MKIDSTEQKGTAMAVVVSDWIDRYKEDNELATLELVNYVVQVCISARYKELFVMNVW